MNFENLSNNETICSCCGSRGYSSDRSKYPATNHGIVTYPSATEVKTDTDNYWEESIPIDNEFLVIRHRKVGAQA
jgi:hypothetical protein